MKKDENKKVVLTMRKNTKGPSMKVKLIEEHPNVLSNQEKEMLCILLPEAEALPYKLEAKESIIGTTEMIYNIPMEDKEKVFNELWPFEDCPKMDANLYDIHERKYFTFKDAMVTRWNGRNMIVSPYFLSCGGMLVDFLPDEATDTFVQGVSK